MTVNFIDKEAGSEFLEDLLEQAMLLYTTVQGTCPGNRDFGITPLATDVPMPVAEQALTLDIISKTETYLPMLQVESVEFSVEDEVLVPHVLLSLNEDYFEDDEEDEDDE